MKKYDMKSLRERIIETLKQDVEQFGLSGEPVLFVQPSGDPRAASYVKSKSDIMSELGLTSVTFQPDININCEAWNIPIEVYRLGLKYKIPTLIQLPFDKFEYNDLDDINILDLHECYHISSIDIDRLTSESKAELSNGNSYGYLLPCTVNGIKHIISDYLCGNPWEEWNRNILYGRNIVVLGRGELVGKPLVRLLQDAGATVIQCNAGTLTTDLIKYCKMADIVITATGHHGAVKTSWFDDDHRVLIIDAGVSFKDGKLYGDLEKPVFEDTIDESMYKTRLTYTPHIGGVGPMTVLSVAENAIELYKWHLENRQAGEFRLEQLKTMLLKGGTLNVNTRG